MRKIDYLLDRDPFEALIWPRQCLVSNPKRCGDQAAESLLHATHLYQRGLSNGVNIKWLAESRALRLPQ